MCQEQLFSSAVAGLPGALESEVCGGGELTTASLSLSFASFNNIFSDCLEISFVNFPFFSLVFFSVAGAFVWALHDLHTLV